MRGERVKLFRWWARWIVNALIGGLLVSVLSNFLINWITTPAPYQIYFAGNFTDAAGILNQA